MAEHTDAGAISVATAAESEQVVDLWIALAESQRNHGSHLLPVENRSQIREAILRHIVDDAILVAGSNEPIGFVMFTIESGYYEQAVTRGIIENLYVQSGHRGQGIGSRLLDAAEQTLAESGVERIALEVMAPNERARQFYRERGYEPHRIEFETDV